MNEQILMVFEQGVKWSEMCSERFIWKECEGQMREDKSQKQGEQLE